ncbi:nucleotide exchange factor GrpE [Micrococcales bacterium 31B]|nr:nucleotide exchange factor GrpE [Micrococcales bacterium 31B]
MSHLNADDDAHDDVVDATEPGDTGAEAEAIVGDETVAPADAEVDADAAGGADDAGDEASPAAPASEADLPEVDVNVPDDASELLEEPSADARVAELENEVKRVQAEYVNYKNRVDRDRAVAGDLAKISVLNSLLPVLDDIAAAQAHGDLEGTPFESIANKLNETLGRLGLVQFGEVGEEFDPKIHEALMHVTSEDATGETIAMVLQPGYRLGERILRATRVQVQGPA